MVPVGFSDHCPIIRLKFPRPNYDPGLFRADLNHIPWDITELESNPDNAWNSFKDLFMTAADCNAPVVNCCVHRRSSPWVTPTITYYKGLDEKA